MTCVLVVRHPPVHRQGRCVGQSTVPTTMPVEQAAAEVLQTVHAPLRGVVTSDLPRCRDLATQISSELGLRLDVDARLREMSFGHWEGRTFDAIAKDDPLRWQAWCDDWVETRPPGGESALDLTARVGAWLQHRRPDPRHLIVTHAGVIRALQVLGGASWPAVMRTAVPFLEPREVDVDVDP